MNNRAEVVKTFGRVAFQVNIINTETGVYRNSLSRRFETKKEALEFISHYGLTIKKQKTMKSGNFIKLTFVVKGGLQVEYINAGHVSRIMYVDGKPFIGMLGQTYTRQLTETSMQELTECINLKNN